MPNIECNNRSHETPLLTVFSFHWTNVLFCVVIACAIPDVIVIKFQNSDNLSTTTNFVYDLQSIIYRKIDNINAYTTTYTTTNQRLDPYTLD